MTVPRTAIVECKSSDAISSAVPTRTRHGIVHGGDFTTEYEQAELFEMLEANRAAAEACLFAVAASGGLRYRFDEAPHGMIIFESQPPTST